ncbi:Aspartate/methionine/tyrosine aminotransferase [Desulfonauticus submarinus]|uniref:Aminotransferase n=1 Tax=Desulfonauticus submarinus TaxID=206665 RepID=A0A1H0DHH8_9BACT|nr:pyridoxal phosphate-dependent aminotransferase [Desulfonauticus submarinus]SDN69486.1 Aspartate/methionine/tyrosine aminotransferase [Desulfonauticus submarinus]
MPVPKHISKLTSFIVMDILETAQTMEQQGTSVIHLEIGEPDFPPSPEVKQAILRGVNQDFTHYTHSQGMLPLREALSEYYLKKYKLNIHPDQFFITQGTSPALLMTLNLLLNPGDEVIITDPCYACYPNFIQALNAKPIRIPIFEQSGYKIEIELVKKHLTSRTKVMLINSPANPTGILLSSSNLKQLADLAEEKNFFIISDEIYHGLVYDTKEHSILEFTNNAFVLNGFSKLFAMTGLRLGYIIAPRPFIPFLRKMAQNFFICANSLAQLAGIAALTSSEEYVQNMVKTFSKRRKFILKELKKLGFNLPVEPQGAFYVFVNASHLTKKFAGSSLKLAQDILKKAHVGITPGIDFGPRGEGYLRFSYANSLDNLKQGLKRLQHYLNSF